MYTLANITATICAAFGATPPAGACQEPIETVAQKLAGIERCLFFSPDAIAQWLFDKYSIDFAPLAETLSDRILIRSVMPSVTPVCYGTMLSGLMPEAHGIRKYEKFALTVDTLFHSLDKAGKKCCIIASPDSSCEIIFRNSPAVIIPTKDDSTTLETAKDIIKQDIYDFVMVYQCGYDDTMHATQPESDASLAAMRFHIASYLELSKLARTVWQGKKAAVTFSPDHGIHTDPVTKLGTHGTDLDADMNIYHLFGVL